MAHGPTALTRFHCTTDSFLRWAQRVGGTAGKAGAAGAAGGLALGSAGGAPGARDGKEGGAPGVAGAVCPGTAWLRIDVGRRVPSVSSVNDMLVTKNIKPRIAVVRLKVF